MSAYDIAEKGVNTPPLVLRSSKVDRIALYPVGRVPRAKMMGEESRGNAVLRMYSVVAQLVRMSPIRRQILSESIKSRSCCLLLVVTLVFGARGDASVFYVIADGISQHRTISYHRCT